MNHYEKMLQRRRLHGLREKRNTIAWMIKHQVGDKWDCLMTAYQHYLVHYKLNGDMALFLRLWDAFIKARKIYPSYLLDAYVRKMSPDYLLYINNFVKVRA